MSTEQQKQDNTERHETIKTLRRILRHDESNIRLGRFSFREALQISEKVTA
jgi:hypothetical protein